MSKILIDSSVYLSIFLGDSNYTTAIKLITPYLNDSTCQIYLPTIIIAEVINVLAKTKTKEQEINDFTSVVISSPRYRLIETDLIFHFKEIRNNAPTIKLKTSNLIIYSIAKLHQVDKILTIDKQLANTPPL